MPLRGGRTWHGPDLISVIDRFDAMWNAQDLEAVLEIFTDDAMMTIIRSGHERPKVIIGREQIRELLRPWLPGSSIRSRSHYVDGDRVIWITVAYRDYDHFQGFDEATVKCEAVVRGDEIAMLTVSLAEQVKGKRDHQSHQHRVKSRESGLAGTGKSVWTLYDVPMAGMGSVSA